MNQHPNNNEECRKSSPLNLPQTSTVLYREELSNYWQNLFDEESLDYSGRQSLDGSSRSSIPSRPQTFQYPKPVAAAATKTTTPGAVTTDENSTSTPIITQSAHTAQITSAERASPNPSRESLPTPEKNPLKASSDTKKGGASTIWSKLSAEEERKARLRSRLTSMRDGAQGGGDRTGSTNSESSLGRHSGSSLDSMDSAPSTISTPQKNNKSSPIPSQEEARRLAHPSRHTPAALPPHSKVRKTSSSDSLLPRGPSSSSSSSREKKSISSSTKTTADILAPVKLSGRRTSRSTGELSAFHDQASPLPPTPMDLQNEKVVPLAVAPSVSVSSQLMQRVREQRANTVITEQTSRRNASERQYRQSSSRESSLANPEQRKLEQDRMSRPINHQHETAIPPQDELLRRGSTLAVMERQKLEVGPSRAPRRHRSEEITRPDLLHQPGAFSVEGPEAHRHNRNIENLDNSSPPASPSGQQSVNANSVVRQPMRSVSGRPVMAVAAMVVEDYEREVLTEREQQLREQEAEIAAKMAKLQAWEEQLKQEKLALESLNRIRSFSEEEDFIEAEVVVERSGLSDEGEHFEELSGRAGDRRSKPRRWSLFSGGRDSGLKSMDSSNTTLESLELSAQTKRPASFSDEKSPHLDMWEINLTQAEAELGPGPLRFALHGERQLELQIMDLPHRDKRTLVNLKNRWEDHMVKSMSTGSSTVSFDMPIMWHLRYLRTYAKRDGTFVEERAYNAEKKLRKRFVRLNAFALTKQLQSKTLFPVPGLKTKDGHAMFYMRPSRYFPGRTTTKAIIDNLCYVMNTMLEKEHAQLEGIGFIACMDGWKMQNFEINYCYQFMMALQGCMVPVKTQLFLIVNPPTWFGLIWRLMKPMLAPSFRKRVKICNEIKISKYLAPDFESYLPDDMESGQAKMDDIVQDFICFRRYAERNAFGNEGTLKGSDHSGDEERHEVLHNYDLADLGQRWSESQSASEAEAVAALPRDSESSVTDSANRSFSHKYTEDDDDLASIDAYIGNEELSDDDEDMKQAASVRIVNKP